MRGEDRVLTWVLAVETTRESDVRQLRDGLLSPQALATSGAADEEMFGTFRMLYSVRKGG